MHAEQVCDKHVVHSRLPEKKQKWMITEILYRKSRLH